MKRIPLFRLKKIRVGYTKVSNRDFKKLSKLTWWAWWDGRSRYARSGNRLLHRLVRSGAEDVHHKDGDGWNNQRANLLGCSRFQHAQFIRRKQAGATSRFVGVCWHSQRKKWAASVRIRGKRTHLGLFDSEIAAARAYRGAKAGAL